MTRSRAPEGIVKDRVKAALRSLGPDRCYWLMPVMGEFGSAGIPDVLCCIDGQFIAIEVKRGKATVPTTRQEIRMDAVRRAGGRAFVVHADNIDEFEQKIQALIDGLGHTQ